MLDAKGSKVMDKLRRQIIYWMSKIELGIYGRGRRGGIYTPLSIFGRIFGCIERDNLAGRKSSWSLGKIESLLEADGALGS